MRGVACVAVLCLSLLLTGTVAASPQWELLERFQVAQTWASIHGRYGKVWPNLHPRYQRVTTRAFWEACQRKRAMKRAGAEWISVKSTGAYPDRITLPLLGSMDVIAVGIEARFKYRGTTQTVRETHYWVTDPSVGWAALWDPATYRSYKRHRCPT